MSREFLEDWIRIYESEPCLWLVKSKEYHAKNKREAAYSRLLEKLKEIEPYATKDSVIKKINNLRSSHRKELKKVNSSIKLGAVPDEIYKPKLWYFNLLSFVSDQDNARKSCTNIYSSDDNDVDEGNDDTEEEEQAEENETTQLISNRNRVDTDENSFVPVGLPRRRPRTKENVQASNCQISLPTSEVLQTFRDHFKKPRLEDRFDIFGKSVAIKLRDLPRRQMLLAEKLINEILFEAEMGTLTLTHRLFTEYPQLVTPTSLP